MRSAADREEVAWPEPARLVTRIESTRSCAASARQVSARLGSQLVVDGESVLITDLLHGRFRESRARLHASAALPGDVQTDPTPVRGPATEATLHPGSGRTDAGRLGVRLRRSSAPHPGR